MTTTLTAPAGQTPTGVRCGNHGKAVVRHETTAQVRLCFERTRRAAEQEQDQDDVRIQVAGELAAEAAVERFFEERGYDDAREEEDREARMGVIPFSQAYEEAAREATQPWTGRYRTPSDGPREKFSTVVSAKAATIPVSDTDGFAGYATYAADGTTVDLWEVERPTEGKHSGATFVRPATKTWRDNLKGAERTNVILAIAEDPRAAALLYAQKTSKCGICRRALKTPESVARGMGPVCAKKFA